MRKKCSRLEDDNDSLAMQLKKMAMKARRRPSPSPGRLSTPEPLLHEKDEGIAEDDDPSELRLQLELNEQEAAVLRRKVEELEKLNESNQRKMKELQEKAKAASTPTSPRTVRSDLRPATSSAAVLEKKISVLEEESSELRKKLIEKERDYERLQTELTLAHKRSKTSARSRSLDSNEQALDLKRQLQVIEAEANVLRSKTQDLEAENEKLSTENKKLSIKAARGGTPAKDPSEGKELKEKVVVLEKELAELRSKEKKPAVLAPNAAAVEVERLKNQLTKVEKENERLKEGGARLRTRTPKRPTDLTTKLQMKKMVDELELEVAELLAGLGKAQEGKADASEKQTAAASKELEEIQKERDSLKAELAKTKESLQKDKTKTETDLKKLKSDVVKSKEEVAKLQAENKSMKENLESLKTSQESAKKTQEEKAQVLSELEEAKALASAFQRESEEKIKEEGKKNEAERAKLQKELAEKTKKLLEAEKKAKETEEKLKKAEKILSGKKDKLAKAEKDLEAEREKVKQSESTQKEVAVGWLRERDELKANATEMSRKVEQLQEQLSGRVREVETLENSLVSERERVSELMSSSESSKRASTAAVEKQLEAAREELAAAKTRAAEISSQLEKAEKAKKEADDKAKKEISDLQKKLSDTESGRSTEVKKLELQVKEKEQEVRSLNNQLKSAQQDSGASSKKISELQDEFGKKIKELEKDLAEERHEYEDLTVRYEQLETEHVVTKAQLTMDREKAEGSVDMAHRELTTLERELQTLRDTYNAKQDEWIKEKLDMQALVRDLEDKVQRSGSESLDMKRLKAQLDEKTTDFDKTKHELDVMTDQNSNLRKEADDLRRKLEDYERVAKIQRNMTADSAALDKEIKQLKSKMAAEEKSHKAEVAQLKLRYDSRVALISEEMQTLQNQVSKFKKERDSQRHMLEAAQKTIGELKASGKSLSTSASHMEPGDESEETRTKVASLEQSLACMEDELSDARLEASKLKTELVSERSAWEVKISEMQSRLNEFEEDRLISSGRTKIPGMRTRIELAWQKERDEQHRLLQETSTLARDLRQTLFEVERERDKERLESKRKIDQIKRSMEEELEENRKKITEMQYDLLELRDAHAKVRTTNEKLRRERERHEKERDENRQMTNARKRQDADEERKVNALLEQVDELMRLAPDLFPQRDAGGGSSLSLPKAPNRSSRTNLSREPSPATGGREASVGVEDRKQLLQSTLSRLTEATSELRRHQRLGEDEKDRERARRTLGFRRAASTEADAPEESKKGKANGSGKKGLFRKSLSLEQTGGMAQDQKIWKGEGGSNSSLDVGSEVSLDSRFLNMPRREVSLDRLSTDSTQSEIVQDKKKKGFFGKLKKLASSRSIDNDADRQTGGGSLGGSGSDISVDISTADSGKKDKKGKLMGLFKKGSARSSSVEKSGGAAEKDSMAGSTDSLQRPLRASSASRPLAPSTAAPTTPATPAPTAKRYYNIGCAWTKNADWSSLANTQPAAIKRVLQNPVNHLKIHHATRNPDARAVSPLHSRVQLCLRVLAHAFIKHWKQLEAKKQPDNITDVEIFGLDGNPLKVTELAKFDCNLVKKDGCEQWQTHNFAMKSNNYENYPPVTDFRWHDLPVYSGNRDTFLLMKEFRKKESINAHFSMLTNDLYQVLFLDERSSAIFKRLPNDGRPETSLMLEIPREFSEIGFISAVNRNDTWFPYESMYVSTSMKDLWKITSLNYATGMEVHPLESDIELGDGHTYFKIMKRDSCRGDFLIPSIRMLGPTLVKYHTYNLLVPKNSNASMERELEIKEESPLCVDVVYLLKNKLSSSESVLNVTLTSQNGRTEHFTEAPNKAAATWHVARFENPHHRLQGKVKIRLDVGAKDVEIGGVKFCTGGDSVVMPKDHSVQDNCQIMADESKLANRELSHFTGYGPLSEIEVQLMNNDTLCTESKKDFKEFLVAATVKICERLGKKDCSNMNAHIHCFAGYSGKDCETPCSGTQFGVNCAENYTAGRCLNDEFSRHDGSCKVACANESLSFPNCTSPIRMTDSSVVSVSRTTIKLRIPDSIELLNGHDNIAVRYKKKDRDWWRSKAHSVTDGRFITLKKLEPNTDYEIAIGAYESNSEMSLQNEITGEKTYVRTCRPIDGSNLKIQVDDSGAALFTAAIDEDYCHLDSFNIFIRTYENSKETSHKRFPMVNETHFEHKLRSCSSGSYYDVTLLDINRNEVKARLNCASENHLALLSPPKNPMVPNRCKPIDESSVQITIIDPFKVVISSSERSTAADRIKLCAPAYLKVSHPESKKILFTKQVDGSGSEIDFGECVPGSNYDVTLVDEQENEFTVKHLCLQSKHRIFQRIMPKIKKIGARKIELFMLKSKTISGFTIIHSGQIQVQFIEQDQKSDAWKSVNFNMSSTDVTLTLDSLKPGKSYLIRYVWSAPNHPTIEGKTIKQQTLPCIPIDKNMVEVKYEVPLTLVTKVQTNVTELEDLCHVERMKLTSGGKTVVDTTVYESVFTWNYTPCDHGREYICTLIDEQGNSVKANGTCSSRHENDLPANVPNLSSSSPWANLTPKSALGSFRALQLLVFSTPRRIHPLEHHCYFSTVQNG
ncbi:Hypothetical predicted protein [Cloeon dipterum]|uniref:Uncharacterized protein n=1 Tax=Cloeon dipterum TaxID=197152 RepID=A0A8S1D0S1_9INSE|nr:Hypothetical predicted protein [Cloeon dipterum]